MGMDRLTSINTGHLGEDLPKGMPNRKYRFMKKLKPLKILLPAPILSLVFKSRYLSQI